MKKRYLLILIALILVILSLGRLKWMNNSNTIQNVEIQNGDLDLRNWTRYNDELLVLDGEWEFYPNQFLYGEYAQTLDEKTYIQVPNAWNDKLSNEEETPFGYGTYRLRIHVDPETEVNFAIYVSSVRSASELYVNGRLLEKSGEVAPTEENYYPRNLPYTASFTPDEDGLIEITIQAANYRDSRGGGVVRSMKFGTEKALDGERNLSVIMQAITVIIFLILSIYLFIFYLVGKREKKILAFSLFLLSITLMNHISNGEKILHSVLNLDYDWAFKLSNGLIPIAWYLLLMTLDHKQLPIWRNIYKYIEVGIVFLSLLIIIVPVEVIIKLFPLYLVLASITFLVAVTAIFKQIINSFQANVLILLAFIILVNELVWTVYWREMGISVIYYPFDIVIAACLYSTIWFLDYIKVNAETKKLAENLQAINKQKDQFLAQTSHEFKNPLNGILNMTQSVLDREKPLMKDRSIHELKTIMTVGRRMSILLNDLIDLVSLEDGKPRLNMHSISLPSVLTDVIHLVKFDADSKGISLHNKIPVDFPLVYADENRLAQIIFNLVHNAIKYTDYGEITIHAEVKSDKAYISIIDTGKGIDSQTQTKLFDVYERGTDEIGGFGLGLGITKQLVELHGGEIVFSSKVGRGSTFTFSLDIDRMMDQPANEKESYEEISINTNFDWGYVEAENTNHQRPRILLVDDDPINLQVFRTILDEQYYDLKAVINGEQALQELKNGQWNLVISDIMMPKMSGYELTKKIRESFGLTELPIILVTARNNPKDIEAGFQAGANDYVTKPIEAIELRARVNALTGIKEMVNNQLKLESAWLQAQIHPHFIFNTLNSIIALSELDQEKMRKLLNEFSMYLRSKYQYYDIDELIPLKEELKVVRSYLNIEQVRFGKRLKVIWQVELEDEIKVPFLSIQPLVENAVHHGIMRKAKGGSITICTKDHGDKVQIIIKDNGVGMDSKQLSEVMNKENASRAGVGLLNTHQRIKRLFGTGLTIKSEKGKGTTIFFYVNK